MMTSTKAHAVRAALLCAGCLCAAAPAVANAAPDEAGGDGSDRGGARMITVLGAPQPAPETGASVAVVDREDLDRRQIVAVADALADIAGVAASRNGPRGSFTGVRIRGADASQTLVLIDGIRVGDPSSPGGGFDFGNLLTGAVDRVEVLRGSASVPWGSDAIGGVVLVDLAGAPAEAADTRASGLAEIGARQSGRASGLLRGQLGGVGFGASIGHSRTAGVSAAAAGTERDGFRQTSGHVRLSADPAPGLSASMTLLHSRGRLELDGFAPPFFVFGDTDEFQRTDETYAGVTVRHDAAAGRFVHRLTVSLADINRDSFDPAAGARPTFAARGRTERLAWQGDWTPADALRLVFGIDRERSAMRTADAFSRSSERTGVGGGYVQAVVDPLPGLTLVAGARRDDHRDFGGVTTMAANAAWRAGDWTVRASVAEGYKAPTLFQLADGGGSFGNPALHPERSRTVDAGLAWHGAARGVTGELSLYRRDSRGLIDFVTCTGPVVPAICAGGQRPFGTYDNIARARAEGVEAALRWQPAGDRWHVAVSYALTATRDRAPDSFSFGKRLPRRPLDTLAGSLDRRFGPVRLGVDVRHVGRRFDDRANRVRLAGYTLVTLRAAVELGDGLVLQGRIENAGDVRYQSVAGYGVEGRGAFASLSRRF